MKPIDTAIYWAEFVMRHNGTKHLQNKSMRLYRFQNLLLDVALFIAAVMVLIGLTVRKLYMLVLQLLIGKKTHITTKKKIKKN